MTKRFVLCHFVVILVGCKLSLAGVINQSYLRDVVLPNCVKVANAEDEPSICIPSCDCRGFLVADVTACGLHIEKSELHLSVRHDNVPNCIRRLVCYPHCFVHCLSFGVGGGESMFSRRDCAGCFSSIADRESDTVDGTAGVANRANPCSLFESHLLKLLSRNIYLFSYTFALLDHDPVLHAHFVPVVPSRPRNRDGEPSDYRVRLYAAAVPSPQTDSDKSNQSDSVDYPAVDKIPVHDSYGWATYVVVVPLLVLCAVACLVGSDSVLVGRGGLAPESTAMSMVLFVLAVLCGTKIVSILFG
jgi:hypothetical protein